MSVYRLLAINVVSMLVRNLEFMLKMPAEFCSPRGHTGQCSSWAGDLVIQCTTQLVKSSPTRKYMRVANWYKQGFFWWANLYHSTLQSGHSGWNPLPYPLYINLKVWFWPFFVNQFVFPNFSVEDLVTSSHSTSLGWYSAASWVMGSEGDQDRAAPNMPLCV